MSKSKRKKLTADDNGGDKVDANELVKLLCDTTISPTYPFRQGQKDARWRINVPLLPNKLLDEYKRLFKLILLNRQRALTSQEREEFNQLAILLEQRMPLTEKELDLIMQTVGSYAMSKIGKFLQQRCNVTILELDGLSWPDILEHLTLQAELASERKNEAEQITSGGRAWGKKKRKKTPPQLLKETRERQAAKELAKNPNITAKVLGTILGCDKSTIVRLKAWQNRRTLAYSPPPNGFKKQDDEGRTDTEAIGENESNNEIENL